MALFEKMRPLGDRVLVQRIEADDKTPGGIIIPDSAKEKAQTGRVISVGKGRISSDGKIVPMQVKEGDHIFFGKYSGTDAGNDYLIIKEDEILGVLEK
jgi:chaperonin GroES